MRLIIPRLDGHLTPTTSHNAPLNTQYYGFLDNMQTINVVAYKDVDRQETRPSEDWNYLREQKVCILMNEGITSNAYIEWHSIHIIPWVSVLIYWIFTTNKKTILLIGLHWSRTYYYIFWYAQQKLAYCRWYILLLIIQQLKLNSRNLPS